MSKRDHVRGNSGPKRHQLPTFRCLDQDIYPGISALAKKIALDDPTRNDVRGDAYQISNECPLPDMFSVGYRQVLLQNLEPDADPYDEKKYTMWSEESEPIREYFEDKFGYVSRARIAITPPGGELAWHIDTDTSVLCRVQIGVRVADSVFEFNRRGTIESFTMDVNELWFINVGWNHRVLNNSPTEPRIVVIAGVLYDNLKHLL